MAMRVLQLKAAIEHLVSADAKSVPLGITKMNPETLLVRPCPENATTVGNASNSIDLCNIGM